MQVGEEDFKQFVGCLHFNLGFDCSEELEKRIAERMEHLHLRSDSAALLIAVGIVRNWIKAGEQRINQERLEATLQEHDLYLPEEKERCMTVYLTTIKEQTFDLKPDYVIDWRDHFIGTAQKKSHQIKDPSAWNDRLLPELEALEVQINQETQCRLVKVRGLARLSAWFAFGFFFSEVARYTLEVDQNSRLWRTDAGASSDFQLTITSDAGSANGETLDGEGAMVAVGISVATTLDEDVRAYLAQQTEKVSALLLLRPGRELGRTCLRNAGDVVALADNVKSMVRSFVKKRAATRLLLFYSGPLSGACFIGRRLNAVCREIQIMEDQQPGYEPSFLLR